MKLYLSSESVPDGLIPCFKEFVGKPLQDLKFALIENAADPYPEEKRGFVYESRECFERLGIQITYIDLREAGPDLRNVLSGFDVIWVGGGNLFYLRWLFRESGLETILPELLEQGILYGGESAGSVIMGPSLKMFDKADNPSRAPEIIWDGLGIVDVVILPHWETERYHAILQKIKKYYDEKGYDTIPLTDEQTVIIDGNQRRVYP